MASIDRRPNGKWRARWREHPQGPQRTRAFARKRDAEVFLIEVEHQLARGTYLPAEVAATTWSDFVPVFLDRQVWRPATHDVGARALRRAGETWGDRPLASIRSSDVQNYVRAGALAPSSLRTELQHIGAVFTMAIIDGLIIRSPMKGVRVPKPATTPPLWLPRDHVDALTSAAPDWFRIGVVVGHALGLRQSELRGLTHTRVRHLQREVLVDRQAARHGLAWAPTKNSVVRTIPTDATVIDAIEEHRAIHGVGPEGLVLHRDGDFVTASMFDRAWRRTRTGAGLPAAVRFHDLRHTLASELLSAGLSPIAVAAVLGDEPATVLATYGHVVTSDHDRVRAVVRTLRAPGAEDSLRTAGSGHPF